MSKESKHLKAGCPLPIALIAQKRKQFTREARFVFSGLHMDGVIPCKLIRETVTQRTTLYMNKFRNQTTLPEHLEIDCPSDINFLITPPPPVSD